MTPSVTVPKPVQRRQVLNQLFHTAALRGLSMWARAVTFALVVRLLTPRDYGWYALINTTLAISVAVSTLNLASYLIRELPGRDEATQFGIFRRLLGPVFAGNVVLATVGAAWAGSLAPGEHAHLAPLAAFISIVAVVNDLTENFFLGCKRIERANWMMGARTVSMATIISGLAVLRLLSLEAVLAALLVAEILAFAMAARWLRGGLFWRAAAPWPTVFLCFPPVWGS